jgi:hypothetical protein
LTPYGHHAKNNGKKYQHETKGYDMKRRIVMVLGVTALVAVGVLLAFLRPDPTGMAIGRLKPAERAMQMELWSALQPGGETYLKEWADELANPPEDPLLLVEAFNELAYAVTGPMGFWRKTVPNQFLGCQADPDTAPCLRLSSAAKEFERWDALQKRLGKLETTKQARRALRKDGPAMAEYLRDMVPQARSLDALQETPFFAKTLAPVLPQ